VPVLAVTTEDENYDILRLLEERSVATNTAAAGGNASLLAIAV
jgi:delta 1-pyrroline-5-carboxylate dehydrogenase